MNSRVYLKIEMRLVELMWIHWQIVVKFQLSRMVNGHNSQFDEEKQRNEKQIAAHRSTTATHKMKQYTHSPSHAAREENMIENLTIFNQQYYSFQHNSIYCFRWVLSYVSDLFVVLYSLCATYTNQHTQRLHTQINNRTLCFFMKITLMIKSYVPRFCVQVFEQ